MINTVKKIMDENVIRREVEKKLCEELGIFSRGALPHEHVANFNALLEERISKAFGGGTLMEENERAKDEDKKKKDDDDTPPFDADKKKSTPWTSPASKAKHLARNAMKDMVKKAAKKVDEETVYEGAIRGSLEFGKDDALKKLDKIRKKKKKKEKIRKALNNLDDNLKSFSKKSENKLDESENLQELSKKTLKSYIKTASVDATNHTADAEYSRTKSQTAAIFDRDHYAKMNTLYQRKADKRLKGIVKATDKLEEDGTEVTLESVMQEITRNLGEEQFKELVSPVFEQELDASGLEVTPRGAPQGPYTRARGQRTIRMAQGNYDRLRQTQRNIAARPDTPDTSTSSKPAETSSTRPGTTSAADYFRGNPNVPAREPNPRTIGITRTAQAAPTPARPTPTPAPSIPSPGQADQDAANVTAADKSGEKSRPSAPSAAAAAITRSAPRARPATPSAPSTASSSSSSVPSTSSSSGSSSLPQASRSGNTAQDDEVQRRNLKPQDVSTM